MMGIFWQYGGWLRNPINHQKDGFSTHPKYWDVYHLSTAQEYGDICGFPIPDEP
jgi:hypothetical protein